jgi:acyl transferase
MTEPHSLFRIVGSRTQRIAAVLERAQVGPSPRPMVVIAPAFEHTIRNSFVIARYLLGQGFDVLRYDACNHVGLSDGSIEDFTLTSALDDLLDVARFCRVEIQPVNLSLVATSLAGRVAIRAAAKLPGEFSCVGSIACVVDVRETVKKACGIDRVGDWSEGRATDPNFADKVVRHPVKYAFSKVAVEDRWDSLETTLRDLQEARDTPLFDVQGEDDPWVSTTDLLELAKRTPNLEVLVLRRAVHELNAATSSLALRHLARFLVRRAQQRDIELDAIGEPRWDDLVVVNKRERSWERTPLDAWVIREAKGNR